MNGETVQLIKQLERRIGKLEAQIVRQRFSGARVYNSGNITLSTGSGVNLTFDSERWDSDAYHDTSSNTDRLVIPIDGVYRITGNVAFNTNATGYRQLVFSLNDSITIAAKRQSAISGISTIMDLTAEYQMVAGDYVVLRALQNSGGNLDVVAAGNYSPEFSIALLG